MTEPQFGQMNQPPADYGSKVGADAKAHEKFLAEEHLMEPIGSAPRWNPLAWVSLGLAVTTLWGLGSLAAIVTGLIALHQVSAAEKAVSEGDPDAQLQRGKALSIVGTLLGAVGVAAALLVIVAGQR
ncbi:MAG: hypothetical protein LBB54_00560 [Cellulomonadaceae bacterium]|jgi:hypothetical protein|nr:hypothetical protein [Cellulomonadaceae bacterium]